MSNLIRLLLHIPVGVLGAWLFGVGIGAAFIFNMGFLFYEWIEDWRIEDHAYLDLRGYLAGFAGYWIVISVVEFIGGN